MKPVSTDFLLGRTLERFGRSRASTMAVWIALALLAGAVVWVHAQDATPAKAPAPKMTRPPLSHLYVAFLLYQNHLDRAAATREQQGKDGSWLRDHFEKQLGFEPSQFQIVRETGVRLQSELQGFRSQAETITKADRAAGLQKPTATRIPNPQLQDMMKQRDELIQREIDNLNRDLGPKDAAKLQDFLANHFLRTVKPPHPDTRAHVPKGWPPRPAESTRP